MFRLLPTFLETGDWRLETRASRWQSLIGFRAQVSSLGSLVLGCP